MNPQLLHGRTAAATFAALLLMWLSSLTEAASPASFAPDQNIASGDFLVNSSEVSGEIDFSSPDGIGGNTPSGFDGFIGRPFCHNDPVGKVDYLGLHEWKVDKGTGKLVLLIEKTGWLFGRKPAGEHVLGFEDGATSFDVGSGLGGGSMDLATIRWYLDNQLDEAIPNLADMSAGDQAAALATFLQLVRIEEKIHKAGGNSTPFAAKLTGDQVKGYFDTTIKIADFTTELNPLVSGIAAMTGESPSGMTQYGGGERALIGATSLPGAKLAGAGFAGVAYALSKMAQAGDGLVDDGIRLAGKTPGTSGSFGGVTGATAAERSFLNNVRATFGDGVVFTGAVRHSGNIVIQRSDIPISIQNLRRMQAGNSPFVRNAAGEWEALNLHHIGRQDGKIIEILSSHNTYNPANGGPLHIPGPGGPVRQSGLSQSYWQQRFEGFIRSGQVSNELLRLLGR